MPMPITNSSYSQQINDAFNVLKYAPADKLQALASQVQANPQSPEAMALAMATQFQAEMRQPSAQAPQQTVMEQKLSQLQGLPAVGANQVAFNQAAEQDPMQNAGIAAAPENTGEAAPEEAPQEAAPEEAPQEAMPEEAPQEAAVGGIVSLAHGGRVRGFAQGTQANAEEAMQWRGRNYDEQGQLIPDEEGVGDEEADGGYGANDYVNARNAPKVKEPREGDEEIHEPAPGSSAARMRDKARSSELKQAAADIEELYGPSYEMSSELKNKLEAKVTGANKEKWITALAQGLGGVLTAQTPYMTQALGQGLLAGVSGYQQGAKEEGAAEDLLTQLQLGQEKERAAEHRGAMTYAMNRAAQVADLGVKQQMQQEALAQKERASIRMERAIGGKETSGIVDPREFADLVRQERDALTTVYGQAFANADALEREAMRRVMARLEQYQAMNPGALAPNRGGGGGSTPRERAATYNYMNLMGQ